ncbi:hypothetical protein A2773_06825 [Candidatus Gottesmanbacteria bacterium RIFCSPHIGHO2_01_FULL_39_10]|uniref:DUF5671 domain-containing protein n=1 Tax=Candidatus Gottesmanbacteria bacterium RIFCSPHIGHO2_01_FULL_39_10 TaxID=1798375 RepID=A0A1F5ZQK3_9BACT|nr:MAG: hypothetical protein A2773_06825 [Candidatus Gottesmanbacteria bacterium RIFCSPHIGHO2_01_FULL_39_10]
MVRKTHSEKVTSRDNQQERSVRIKNTVVALILVGIGFLLYSKFFDLFVDPYIVPIFGMRPVFSAITALIFMLPGLFYGMYKRAF